MWLLWLTVRGDAAFIMARKGRVLHPEAQLAPLTMTLSGNRPVVFVRPILMLDGCLCRLEDAEAWVVGSAQPGACAPCPDGAGHQQRGRAALPGAAVPAAADRAHAGLQVRPMPRSVNDC